MTQESTGTVLEFAAPAEDLVAAVQRLLQESDEPLTVSKLRAKLPAALREQNLEEVLQRQVAAAVLYQYPRYRSQQDRYWDRPMPVHVAALVRATLADGPLGRSELRRKLPAYAQAQADEVVQSLTDRGELFIHPKVAGRGSERLGLRPADPKDYLRPELDAVFTRLQPLGFAIDQLRTAAIEMLHEEEWSPRPVPAAAPDQPPARTPPSAELPPAAAASAATSDPTDPQTRS